MAKDKLRRCASCRMDRPEELFYRQDPPGSPPRERASSRCYDCRRAQEAKRFYDGMWSWAAAIVKTAHMRVSHAHGAKGIWTGAVTPNVVKALYVLQNGKCAISRVDLRLPPPHLVLPMHTTLDYWIKRNNMDEAEQGLVPVLVRATRSAEWAPGNISLIATMFEPVYNSAGAVAEVGRLFRSLPVPVIPTGSLISERVLLMEEEIRKEMKNETERQAEEQHASATSE